MFVDVWVVEEASDKVVDKFVDRMFAELFDKTID